MVTTPSEEARGESRGEALAVRFRRERLELLATNPHPQQVSAQVDCWFDELVLGLSGDTLPEGWALAASAGYARSELCPGSDIDVVLLHPKRIDEAAATAVATSLWYPLWDAGLKLSPATHSLDSALLLAKTDLVQATTLLSLRHLSGAAGLTEELADRALAQWRKGSRSWLVALAAATAERHAKSGEVAFLLEPDLKEGRGGLRDRHAIAWAVATANDATADGLDVSPAALDESYAVLLDVRCALHRITGRSGDRLLLQEQDAVAEALRYADADALMTGVSAAGRRLAWASDQFWRRVEGRVTKRTGRGWRAPGRVRLATDIVLEHGEVSIDEARADLAGDDSLVLRVGAAAAQGATLPSRATLHRLQAEAVGPVGVWSDGARNALLTLLGAGNDAVAVIEALDQFDLIARVLPEWAAVRSKPQRNAYHRFTVDRHLCQTAANAATLVRRVARPDLLLVGAWMHDIGKGYPGDHTEVGIEMIRDIGARMGFSASDIEVLAAMVEHHLLLPETATRRDLSDPGTIAVVARAVVDADRLDLLAALTEADSLATGPTAWSDWKATLITELVMRTKAVLAGHRPATATRAIAERHLALVDEARSTRRAQLTHVDDVCTVAAPDRLGLFSITAGVLALHGVDVLAADAWTTDDGIACDEFRVARRLGGETSWKRVEHDLVGALDGTVDIEGRLAEKVRAYASSRRRTSAALAPRAELLIDTEISDDATVIEVRAPDGIALLYRLTALLARLGLDIRHAKVVTLGHEVVDAFYVRRAIPGQGHVKDLTPEIEEALRRGVHDELSDG